MLHTWSHARYKDWRKCRYRVKLKYLDRIVEPRQPLKEGQTEYGDERGKRLHDAAEHYVRGDRPDLEHELHEFRPEYERLRELYQTGTVSLEGEWGMDRDWVPVGYHSKEVWLRLKLDAQVMMSPTHALVIDYKTGKKTGNELGHAEQTQLYALGTLMRNNSLEEVTTELWYPDEAELTRVKYKRDQVMRFLRTWNRVGEEMTTATEFPPNPNIYSCKFCRYGPRGSGVCKFGV